jgi:glycosyltransferase involved in cell wall biosynthesis
VQSQNLYITGDNLGEPSGGGIVTHNEREALALLGEVTTLDRERLGVHQDPFMTDSVAAETVRLFLRGGSFGLAHFYAGTFTETVRILKAAGTVVCYTAAAHDPKLSQEEFERLGIPYPHRHLTEPDLWNRYVGGYLDADVVITPSKRSAAIMRSFGCRQIRVIPHGTEIPPSTTPPPERYDVSYVGATGPDKGLVYLLRAWRTLRYPDSRLLLAGRGTEDLAPLVRSDGGGNVQLFGFVKDVSEIYDACSVYCQPSVTEGFGIEVLEAMAHGRPVVVSEGAGAADAVDDGHDGFVVPMRDPEAVAEKIAWLRDHPHERAEMGLRAREKAETYSWDQIRGGYIGAWRDALRAVVRVGTD